MASTFIFITSQADGVTHVNKSYDTILFHRTSDCHPYRNKDRVFPRVPFRGSTRYIMGVLNELDVEPVKWRWSKIGRDVIVTVTVRSKQI
jgi:hypothetical protein